MLYLLIKKSNITIIYILIIYLKLYYSISIVSLLLPLHYNNHIIVNVIVIEIVNERLIVYKLIMLNK